MEAIKQMEQSDPSIASTFHHFLARLLAERLAENNNFIEAV
jgi:hypothetical protein